MLAWRSLITSKFIAIIYERNPFDLTDSQMSFVTLVSKIWNHCIIVIHLSAKEEMCKCIFAQPNKTDMESTDKNKAHPEYIHVCFAWIMCYLPNIQNARRTFSMNVKSINIIST